MGSIGLRIEVLDHLPNTEPCLDREHPGRFIERAIDCCAQPIKIEGRSRLQLRQNFGVVHRRRFAL